MIAPILFAAPSSVVLGLVALAIVLGLALTAAALTVLVLLGRSVSAWLFN